MQEDKWRNKKSTQNSHSNALVTSCSSLNTVSFSLMFDAVQCNEVPLLA